MSAVIPLDTAHSASAMQALLDDPLLGQCSHASLARLLPHVQPCQWEAGSTLYHAGDAASALYLLTHGSVRRLGVVEPSSVSSGPQRWGEEAAADMAHYLHGAQARSDCSGLKIPRAALQTLLASNPRLQGGLLASLSCHLAGTPFQGGPVVRPATASAATSHRALVGWLLTLLLPLALLLSSHLLQARWGLEPHATIFLAIFTATVCMWVFSGLDDYIPALFALMATLIAGLVPASVILSGFGSDGFVMALSMLALSVVIVSSGLSYRFMLALLLRLPNHQVAHNLGVFLTGSLLTPVIPTANGRVAMLAPFLSDMADGLHLARGGPAATRLAASCFGGLSLLSAAVMTSKSVNLAVFGLLPAQDQDHFQWLTWLFCSLVVVAMLCGVYAVAAALWFRNRENPVLPKALIAQQLELLGPLRMREWAAVGALLFVVLGIVSSSLHKVQPPWLVMAMLLGLLLFGVLRKKELIEQVDWTFLLYLGGVSGMVATLGYLGLDQVLGQGLPALSDLLQTHLQGFVALLFVLICLVRLVVPINATIVVFAAILMPLGAVHGVNPWVLGFMILLFAETWFFPYQCSYYLQLRAVNQARHIYDEPSFLRFNAVMNLARPAAVYASLPFWQSLGLL